MVKNVIISLLVVAFTLVIGCKKGNELKKDQLPGDTSTAPVNPPSQEHYIGVTFGYNELTRSGGIPSASGNTIYNIPLFKSTNDEKDWWDDMVEELAYSGIDFVAPVDRGHLAGHPDIDAGDPQRLAHLVAAMERRGVENKFKIAIFDDNPASWTANRNIDNGDGYDYSPLFDCGDTANYKYIWDYNIKMAFENVPDEMRFKIDGRPVIIFWGIGDYAFTNYANGNLKAILLYIRSKCESTFGFDPYLIVDHSWLSSDPQTNDTAVVDAVHSWFTMANPWTVKLFNKVKVGCAVPGFYVVHGTTNMQIDADHGQTFITGLDNTYNSGSLLTLIEGFTDCAENAAVWRSIDTTYYDYPNQRINILRRYTSHPYPDTLKVEAEGCDFYHDVTVGNSGGAYREGDIDISKTNDANGGWMVTNTAQNEWMEWKELPLNAHTKIEIRYASPTVSSIQFSIDGTALTTVSLPATGAGVWSTITAGTYATSDNGLHTVRLTVLSGTPDINYFDVIAN